MSVFKKYLTIFSLIREAFRLEYLICKDPFLQIEELIIKSLILRLAFG